MPNEIEFLVDGADAKLLCVPGTSDFYFLATQQNPPGALLISSAQNIHQRGCARPVLAKQNVHLALPKLEGHPVQGDDAGKPLLDAEHFQDGLVFHTRTSLFAGSLFAGAVPRPSKRSCSTMRGRAG